MPLRPTQTVYKKAFDLTVSPLRTDLRGATASRPRSSKPTADERNGFGMGCLLARQTGREGRHRRRDRPGRLGQSRQHLPDHPQRQRSAPGQGHGHAGQGTASNVGMWKNTVVLWMGEFGRTPRINQNAGRDHWARCWSVVIGGGAIKGGQIYGATSPDGTDVKDKPVLDWRPVRHRLQGPRSRPRHQGARQPRPAAGHRRWQAAQGHCLSGVAPLREAIFSSPPCSPEARG